MLAREMNDVDVRDNAGNTPLMYSVMGRRPKVLQTVHMHAYTNYKIHESMICVVNIDIK